MKDLQPMVRDYQAFLGQGTARYKDALGQWGLVKFLEVTDNFTLVSHGVNLCSSVLANTVICKAVAGRVLSGVCFWIIP